MSLQDRQDIAIDVLFKFPCKEVAARLQSRCVLTKIRPRPQLDVAIRYPIDHAQVVIDDFPVYGCVHHDGLKEPLVGNEGVAVECLVSVGPGIITDEAAKCPADDHPLVADIRCSSLEKWPHRQRLLDLATPFDNELSDAACRDGFSSDRGL